MSPSSRPETPGIDGVLVVNKPIGPTSHDIVACARRAFRISRVGHTGTLDPHAAGVLPLVLGKATRLAQFLTGREKEYVATVRFGRTTNTYDAAGTVLTDNGPLPSRVALEQALDAFRGTFEQLPPPHSAKKIDGTRAYELARANKPVELRPVRVHVSALDLLDVQDAVARLRVECSAGFYVRSLAYDLGAALGSGGMLEALLRTRSGAFELSDAVDLSVVTPERAQDALAALVPMEELLPELPAARLTADGARRARHGQTLGPGDVEGALLHAIELVRLLDPEGRLLGLARGGAAAGILHPSVILG